MRPTTTAGFRTESQILSFITAEPDDVHERQLRALSDLDEASASFAMQVLQTELDRMHTLNKKYASQSQYRRKYLKLMRHLNHLHGVLPPTMFLKGLVCESKHPVAGGGFADVWIGRLNDSQRVCIKVLRFFLQGSDRETLLKALSKEVLLWRQLRHPNILPFLGVNTELFSPSFCIISPWMSNGDAISYARNASLDLSTKLKHSMQIAQGLIYLHGLDPPVVHGDIKGANILISDTNTCCLADFGLSMLDTQSLNPANTATVQGSLRWLAPEFINPTSWPQAQGSLTSRDIYAFGCTVFELLTGRPPFSHHNLDINVAIDVLNGIRPVLPDPADIGVPKTNRAVVFESIRALLDSCWSEEIKHRPNAQGVLDSLNDIHIHINHAGVGLGSNKPTNTKLDSDLLLSNGNGKLKATMATATTTTTSTRFGSGWQSSGFVNTSKTSSSIQAPEPLLTRPVIVKSIPPVVRENPDSNDSKPRPPIVMQNTLRRSAKGVTVSRMGITNDESLTKLKGRVDISQKLPLGPQSTQKIPDPELRFSPPADPSPSTTDSILKPQRQPLPDTSLKPKAQVKKQLRTFKWGLASSSGSGSKAQELTMHRTTQQAEEKPAGLPEAQELRRKPSTSPASSVYYSDLGEFEDDDLPSELESRSDSAEEEVFRGGQWDGPRADKQVYTRALLTPIRRDDSGSAAPPIEPSKVGSRILPPEDIPAFLDGWLHRHPGLYPSEQEQRQICDATGLSMSQVSSWIIHARRRDLDNANVAGPIIPITTAASAILRSISSAPSLSRGFQQFSALSMEDLSTQPEIHVTDSESVVSLPSPQESENLSEFSLAVHREARGTKFREEGSLRMHSRGRSMSTSVHSLSELSSRSSYKGRGISGAFPEVLSRARVHVVGGPRGSSQVEGQSERWVPAAEDSERQARGVGGLPWNDSILQQAWGKYRQRQPGVLPEIDLYI